MLYFLLVWTVLSFLCSTIGLGLLNGLAIPLARSSDRWILSVWSGVILLATVLLGVALVVPLSPGVGWLVAASLVGLSLIQPQVRTELRHWSRSIRQLSRWTLLLGGAGILLLAAVTTRQVTWIDTGLYHYALIQWLGQVGVVPGLALIFENLGFNSTWFALAAPFSPNPIGPQVTAVLGGWVLLLAFFQLIVLQVGGLDRAKFSDWFLGSFTFLLLLCTFASSNLREIAVSPSPDIPVGFLTGLIPWSMLVISQSERPTTSGQRSGISAAIVPLMLAIGAVTFKLIALPLLVISIIFYFSHLLRSKVHLGRNLAIGCGMTLLLFAPFLATQIQTSGCPFFPSDRFCLDIPTAIPTDVSQTVSQLTHNWLSWYRAQQADISPFSAFLLWLQDKRSNQLLVLLAVGSVIAVAFLYRFARRNRVQGVGWVIATQMVCLSFHAATTLFFRFALPSLLLIPALLIALVGMMQFSMLQPRFRSQFGSLFQRIPVLSLALLSCLMLVIGHQNGWPLLLPSALPPVRVTLKRINDFSYFSPAKNDELCWGTQIPCAFEIKPDVRLRNPDRGVTAGFVRSQGAAQSLSIPASTPTLVIAPSQSPSSPLPNQAAAAANGDAEIWSQLRQGSGYVILFRHALAPGTGDPANFRLDDCATQRNLSAEGRQQAVRLGDQLRQQRIPVARVLSSQWCRCLETARLMDVGEVEPFPVLNSFFQDRSTEAAQTEQLRQLILDNRETKGVTVMVTHQVNIAAISDIVPQSGAGVVMRASNSDRLELIGQLSP